MRWVWVLAVGVWLAMSAQPARAVSSAVPMAAALQAALDRGAEAPGHHGVSAAVVLADGSRWTGVAGRSDAESPLEPHHLIQIASITKTMTAAVILQLIDEGVLRLDDAVERWLPPMANIDGRITLRQLLNHTSGLANYTGTAELRAAIAADPSHLFTVDELLAFVGPPAAAPGVQTQYGNTAFLLLGLVAERATGRAIIDLYHQRLWTPLELTEIFMPGLEDPPRPVAAALNAAGVVAPIEQMAVLSVGASAFGLLASARDVAAWGHALFTGRVISPAMQDEMRRLGPAAGTIPGESGVGLGIRGYTYFDRVQYGHSGGAAFGSSLLLHDPAVGVTVVVLMNQGQGAEHFAVASRLLGIAAP
jgi:D-alanyl-D-alanine carboxypeptidase